LPAGYEVVLGNGGATMLWDMIGLGLVKEKSLHFVCGEFSEKWYKAHANIPWIKAEAKTVAFGEGINPQFLPEYDTTCFTLNETSTGVMISEIPDRKDYKGLILCDATSGAGQIPVKMDNLDVYYFSPQKVLSGEGGLYIAFMSPRAIARIKEVKALKRYSPIFFDWDLALDNSTKQQTYNTPSIINIYLVNEQLKEMNKLGEAKVAEMAKKKANLLYQWAESKSYLSPYIKNVQFRSQAVVTIDVQDSIKVDAILPELRKRKIVYDIDAYRKLGRNQLRISLFHNITFENLEKLTKLLSLIMES